MLKMSALLMRAMWAMLCGVMLFAGAAQAQVEIPTNDPPYYGPFNGVFWAGGEGLKKNLVKQDTVLRADSPWTIYCWLWADESLKGPSLLAGFGKPEDEYSRYLGIDGEKLLLWGGKDNSVSGPAALAPGKWHFVAATFDGSDFRIYSEGASVASGKLDTGSVSGVLQMAPTSSPQAGATHFAGKIAGFRLLRRALTAEELKELAQKPEDFAAVLYEEGSKPWPVQTRGQAGYRSPQDPATMPSTKAAFTRPEKKIVVSSSTGIESRGANDWTIAGGWKLRPAPEVVEPGEAISQSEFNAKGWWVATVPGTVLTTMVDQGVYPDPDYGLNNLAIPESLNKQDYWYRTEFNAPGELKARRLTLTFQGINYAASVWLNGKQIGAIKGAFIRGVFDITKAVKFGGPNVLAVRISPPPHPGIPHEQSIKAGPGENGGIMCLDGPTFVDTEGWDWIPAIRDRDSGIWQPVTLHASGGVRIGDPQVVTRLPLPDTNRAEVEITVPLVNESNASVRGTVSAKFDGTIVTKTVSVAPGKSEVKLSAAEFPPPYW